MTGGAKCLRESVSSSRSNQNHEEEDQDSEEELQPELHGDVGVPDPAGGGAVPHAAGHRLGQLPVPGEHVPRLRHAAPRQDGPGAGRGRGEVVQPRAVLQMINRQCYNSYNPATAFSQCI